MKMKSPSTSFRGKFLSFLAVAQVALAVELTALDQYGAVIDESIITQTVRVEQNGAGDFTSLHDALSYATSSGEPMKIVLAAGVYRDGGYVLRDHDELLVIEGEEAGSVILSGADVWQDWAEEGGGVFSKPWVFDWGLGTYDPPNFHIDGDIAKRVEIVLYNGERLLQVETQEELVAGAYAVDEAADKLFLFPPEGGDLASDVVEVAVRTNCINSVGKSNLVLRNLVFENFASGNQHRSDSSSFGWTALYLSGESAENRAENLLIENVVSRGINASGMTTRWWDGVTFRNSTFIDNGMAGASSTRSLNVLLEDCVFEANNWRLGGYGNFYDWAPAGIKFFLVGNGLIQRSRFINNFANGLWLDTGMENFLVRDCVAIGNYGAGFFLENSYGPILMENNLARGNGTHADKGAGMNRGGILIAEARDVILVGNVVEDNSHAQILISTRVRPDELAGYLSQTPFDGFVEDVTFLYNRVAGKNIPPPVPHPDLGSLITRAGLIQMLTYGMTQAYKDEFLPTLLSNYNSFYQADETRVFNNGDNFGFVKLPLQAWQSLYGHDLDSVWEEEFTPFDVTPSTVLLDRFDRDAFVGENYYESSWFGALWDIGGGWITAESLGYLYLGEIPVAHEWTWSPSLEFLWVQEELYPNVFSTARGWLYLDASAGERWAWSYADSVWMPLD